MTSQWHNFLKNLGEWRGSFATVDGTGQLVDIAPSILTLEQAEEDRLVRFGLRRWPAGTTVAPGGGPEGAAAEPTRVIQQDYRNLGRQVVFFETGTFCKGSLQVAPNTVFGGEFGFIDQDRRHRLVLLYSEAGTFAQLVLIREFRAGRGATERPATTVEQLVGSWEGQEFTITADWPEPEVQRCQVAFSPADVHGLRLLPDGGFCRLPGQVSHREAFSVEGGWLSRDGRMERLIRRYDSSGAWQSATLQSLVFS